MMETWPLPPVLPFHGLPEAPVQRTFAQVRWGRGTGVRVLITWKDYSIYLMVIVIDAFECLLYANSLGVSVP